MKKMNFLRNLVLITTFVALVSCNGQYVYNAKRVKPAMAKVIDLDQSYEPGWSIKIYERKNVTNNGKAETKFVEYASNFFEKEDVAYEYKKLIIYSDIYFAIAYKEVLNSTLGIFNYQVNQFYGPNYKYELIGTEKTSCVYDEKDINIETLDEYDTMREFHMTISEYDKKNDKISNFNEYVSMPTDHEVNYSHFRFRRVLQDKYFAINYRENYFDFDMWYGSGASVKNDDGKIIIGFLGNKFSYNLNYRTTYEEFVL